VVLDVDERQAKIVNVGLNKIGGDFDNAKLAILFKELNATPEFKEKELTLTGFNEAELKKLLDRVKDETPKVDNADKDLNVFGRSVTLSLEFTDIKKRDKVGRILKSRCQAKNLKSGDYVFDLIVGKA
jgi:molybdopterin-biosynthesis enzyme MoeA-like protein